MVYKFGNKKFKTWEEMDEYTRSQEFEAGFKKGKEVKVEWVCIKCKKVINGVPCLKNIYSKKYVVIGWKYYCKKCFKRDFHPKVEKL